MEKPKPEKLDALLARMRKVANKIRKLPARNMTKSERETLEQLGNELDTIAVRMDELFFD